jgi:hypothetical protein
MNVLFVFPGELGAWNPWIIFGIYSGMGLCVGALECSRRVINPFIVGKDDPEKLKATDAKAHIYYEVSFVHFFRVLLFFGFVSRGFFVLTELQPFLA